MVASIICRPCDAQLHRARRGGLEVDSAVEFCTGAVKVPRDCRYQFFKVGIGFSKCRDIGFGFSVRTYHCLSNNTIADTLRPLLSPEWGLGPRICITNCGHKR